MKTGSYTKKIEATEMRFLRSVAGYSIFIQKKKKLASEINYIDLYLM